jgi:hypothetical protein
MRAHHAIAIAAAILIGFGLKLTFFSAPVAEAEEIAPINASTMDISEMHQKIKNLPMENSNDMTFVFSRGD